MVQRTAPGPNFTPKFDEDDSSDARCDVCANRLLRKYCRRSIQPGFNSHGNRSFDKRRTAKLEVVRAKWPAIELLIQPSEDPYFRSAKRFEPAIDEEALASARRRNLLRLGNHRLR